MMPSLGIDDYAERCARRKEREAKLRKLGIIENSSKWNRLLFRRKL